MSRWYLKPNVWTGWLDQSAKSRVTTRCPCAVQMDREPVLDWWMNWSERERLRSQRRQVAAHKRRERAVRVLKMIRRRRFTLRSVSRPHGPRGQGASVALPFLVLAI